jgi:hypothetical protein
VKRPVNIHTPVPKLWMCSQPDCLDPWPCTRARVELLREYSSLVALHIYLATLLVEAARDLPYADPAMLGIRFTGWVYDGVVRRRGAGLTLR